MSENSFLNQNAVESESTTAESLSQAMDEKLVEDSKVLSDTGNLAEPEAGAAQPTETPEESKFNSKFAALSRKERDIRHREAQLEEKYAELEKKLQEAQAAPQEKAVPEVPLEYRLKKNPLGTLEELGLSYEVLTKLALNEGELPADMQMKLMREELERDYKSKFEELENKILEKEKAEEEQKYHQVINSFKSEINEFVTKDPAYELIQANEAQDLVYEVIEEHYNETGRILDTKEAADQVEQYLEEELRTVLKKSKKLGAMTAPQEARQVLRQPTPTLSNSQSARGAVSADTRELSPEESKAKAAQMIRWLD